MPFFDSFKQDFGIHLKRLSELNSTPGQRIEGSIQNIEEMGKHLFEDLIELSKSNSADPEIYSMVLKEIELFQRTLDFMLAQGGGDINQKRQEVAYVSKLFNELKGSLRSELNNKARQNTTVSFGSVSVASQPNPLMGLRKVATRLGLAYTSDEDAEWYLARYLVNKFKLAADKYLQKAIQQNQEGVRFLDCMREVWPENDNGRKFYVTDSFLQQSFPDLCGSEAPISLIRLLPGGVELARCEHNSDTGKYLGIVIAVSSIDASKNQIELEHNMRRILSTVYHECDHVYFKAKVNTDEDSNWEEILLYYIDDAEVRAHSKELAYEYYTSYPKKQFDYRLLKRCIEEKYNHNEKPYAVLRILELFRDPAEFHTANPEAQDTIKNRILMPGHNISKDKLQIAFMKYMNHITYFVKVFNESN